MKRTNAAVTSAIPAGALDDFNWMRGVAATLVLAGHVRIFFFAHRPGRFSPAFRAFYFITGFAHQAVIVFFVLSGFFIGTSVVVPSRDGTWSWRRFLSRRLTRLYVVLLPTLLLTAAWDLAGRSLFGLNSVYGGRLGPLHLADTRTTLTLPVLLGNVAFVEGIFVPSFGTNISLWTLACEFWAYILFPLLYRAAFGNASGVARVLCALGAGVILTVGGPVLRLCFVVWALGAIVAVLWALHRRAFPINRAAMLGTIAVFLLALMISRWRLLHSIGLQDLSLGTGTALLVATLVARGEARPPKPDSRLARAYAKWGDVVASFSYTLYAAHAPIVIFLEAWLMGRKRWPQDGSHVLAATGVGFLIIGAYVYPLSRVTEARTEDVRRWLERWLGPKSGLTPPIA